MDLITQDKIKLPIYQPVFHADKSKFEIQYYSQSSPTDLHLK